MLRIPHFDIPAAGNRRVRIDQVHRIEQPPAIVALVAARLLKPAMRARALHIPVRQEASVVDRIDLFRGLRLDQPVLLQLLRKMLRQLVVRRPRGAAEPVIRQQEAFARLALDLVLLVAILLHRLTRRLRRQLGRRAMLVGRADIGHVMTLQAHHAGIHVRRQHRPGQVAEVLHPVDVGQGRRDQDTPGLRHGARCLSRLGRSRKDAF